MKLKLLFITIALFVVSMSSYGQLLQWNTYGNVGTETTEPSVFNDANIAAVNLTQGTITATANGNRFGGSGWFNSGNTAAGNTLAEAVAGNDYIQFVVTPNSGYSFTPTSFVFNWDNSGTGPPNVVLRSSVDGYSANLGTVAPTATIGTSNTITISGLTNITTATTFRIYGYGATATEGTGGFDIGSNVVNVQLNGTMASTGPTINGVIAANEYGVHTNGSNQQSSASGTWYMKSDATNLYIGISGTNTAEAAVLYLDKNPITPVNGGTNTDGNLTGWNYDGSNFANLQFRSDLVVYFKDGYREYRTADGSGGWSSATSGAGSYASASGTREIAIPWSAVGGQPSAFNWFGYVAYAGGGAYASVPTENPGSAAGLIIGASAAWDRYYTVSTTSTLPFSRNSYTFTSPTDVTSFGAISAYDFTMNSSGRYLSRTGNTSGNWTIGGNLTIGNGTVYLGSGGGSYGTTAVTGNLNLLGGTFDMDQTTAAVSVTGNVAIASGAALKLSGTSGGDLNLAGNWTNSGNFTPNGRAVTFNSTAGTQTITNASGETFNYLTVTGSGTLKLANNVTVNSANGLSLSSSHATSTIDLNGQTLTLSGGGNLNLNTGSRFITSSAAGGIFKITGSTTTVFNVGTLALDANTTLLLDNGSFDCGTGAATTVNGTLQINTLGFITGNTPRYGMGSLLKYNTNGVYNRNYEWNGSTAPVGVPYNVQLSNNTTLNYVNGLNLGDRTISNNLTIDANSKFFMDYGSTTCGGTLTVGNDITSAGEMTLGFASGDDLKIGGNITFNSGYTFDAKSRAIFFTKNGTQIITASSTPTFHKILFAPVSGTTTVKLATGTSLNITAPLAGDSINFGTASNVFDINGNTLTLGTAGLLNTVSGANGTFKGSATSNLTLLGTGSIGTLNFAPSFQNLGTLTLNRQAATVGCVMGSAVTINTALNLTNGLISLGNFDMSLGLSATNTGSANGFVISDPDVGTGMLTKRVNSLGAFTLHIGENTAPNSAQYAPATINFSSIVSFSAQAYYGVQVKDAIHLKIDSPTDYLTKYWIITSSGTFTTPVYSFTGTYTSGAADVNGTESNSISAKWDGTKWTNGEAIGGGTLTINGLTTMATSTTNEISAGNRNREINIKGLTGGTNNITSGSVTANGLNNTLFAATSIGSSATKDYEIQNIGIAALNLTGTPIVSIGGANPGDFTVTTAPSATIIGGSSTSFIITFSPTFGGVRTAIVSIANNDSNENPYTFLIQGTGTCPTTTNTITPTSGPVGTEVIVNATANNLTGATVTFNGVAATSITYVSSSQIKVIVPAGVTSGNLVTTNATGCQATNAFTLIDNKANSCQGGTAASDLFISEVTDSNYGGLTYVEIYNGTGVDKPLSGYSINTASNGGAYSGTPLNLSNVTLAAGSTYVVALGDDDLCTTPYGNGSLAAQVTVGLGINFDANGNDHIALFKDTTKIDSFGVSGDSNWATSTLPIFATETDGATFRRKNTATTLPSTTYSNSDWDIIDYVGTKIGDCANNDYSDIGTYNFISGTPPTVTLHPSYTPTCKATSLTVAGTEGYNGSSLADTKELAYKWLVSAPNATGWTEIIDDTNYSGSSTATLSIADISGVIDYQFYCQIRENTNTCYTASNAVKITDGGTTTWTTPGSWTNGIPTLDKLAIIDYDYNTTTNGDLNACSVKINDGFTLTVTAEKYATIRNDLTVNLTGKLEVLDKGSLVMINDSGTVTNTGTTNIHRQTSPFEPNDYTYWSTPIVSTNIETTFTNLPSFPTTWHTENAYEFNPANYVDADNDGFDDNHDDWSFVSSMTSGKGYIIMVPYKPFPSPLFTQATVVFSGKVNNGVVITPIDLTPAVVPAVADDDFNLVGNPYPSAISADAFINANISTNGTAHNTIEGTLYFWTHIKDLSSSNSGPDAYNYSQDDYAVYTLAGGTATGSGGVKPLGFIASCQGFFVEAVNSGTLIFNNAMRVGLPSTANSQFYKSRTGKSKIVTKDRIWLNLENSVGMFSQQLVGYFDNTTLGFDNGYDGLLSDAGNYVNFYSFIDNDTYKIQGRSTFDENDQVRLGYFSAVPGTFNINIDSKEGVFTNSATDVYLEDKLLNVVHNLKTAPYTFTTEKGTFNDRFILRYTNKTLSNKDFETLENQVLVSNKNKQIKVNSRVETIDKVSVYDLLGRQLFKKEKVNSNELMIPNLVSSQQTLLVKVSLQNGQTVTKKMVY